MIDSLWVLLAVCLLGAVAFYSGAEMGLYSLNRVRLRLRSEQPDNVEARLLLELSSHRDQAVMSVLLLQNLCGYFLTVVTSHMLLEVWDLQGGHVEWYSALILSPTMFVLGDVVPKNWFQQDADRLMYPASRVLTWSVRVLRCTGLPWILGAASRAIAKLAGQDEKEEWLGGRGEVIGLLREGAAEGVLTEEQTEIVERVMAFSRVQVRSIMLPRRRVVTVPIDIDRRTFEHTVRLHPYSRLPIMARDGRSVAGIVTVADVLSQDDFDLQKHLEPPLTLRAGETAAAALVRIQQSGTAMAVVIEPRQPFIGIVTLKDIVDEIFGELPAW